MLDSIKNSTQRQRIIVGQSTEDHKSNTKEIRGILRNKILVWEKQITWHCKKNHQKNTKLDRVAGFVSHLCTVYLWKTEVKHSNSENCRFPEYHVL